MLTLKARITPLSAFGTQPMGDTFFGQLCWAVRNRHGEERLQALLEGYTQGRPFAVVSDAFPAGYLPRPTLPGHWFDTVQGEDRKAVKKRAWMPVERLDQPVTSWLLHCKPADEVPGGAPTMRPQPHNTIQRTTGTTGKGQFAPYAMNQLWFDRKDGGSVAFDLYLLLDETCLTTDELHQLLEDIGQIGFGRDASIGLGKFRVEELLACEWYRQPQANAWLTLAPCAPQGLGWDSQHSFYQAFTRFGRHGDVGVHFGNPFKTPILMARTGAVLVPDRFQSTLFIGQGLGGDGSLSKTIEKTVHQGYAPVIGITLPMKGQGRTS